MSTNGSNGSKGTTTYYNGGVEDEEYDGAMTAKTGSDGSRGSDGSKGSHGGTGSGGSKGSKESEGSKGSNGSDGSKGSTGSHGTGTGGTGTGGTGTGGTGTGGTGTGGTGTKGGPVDGTVGDDLMLPGYTDPQGDMIDGTDGDDDVIYAYEGDDTIDSGIGDDTVYGGAGDDTFLINEEGNGIDNDVIIGGETEENNGGDTIDTSAIGDNLTVDFTAPEAGTITDGTDTTTFSEIERIVLGGGNDTVIGGDGNENVQADGGDDSMIGGGGDDTLRGGSGSNFIDGGDGDDRLTAGDGNDTIIGGNGSDTVKVGNGNNVIHTGSGGIPRPDIGYPGLYAADTDPNDDRDFVSTGDGDDLITTGDDADTISSGGGNDTINAGVDDDEIDAGSGDDLVTAGEGNDYVLGGSGNDTIYGGLGPSFPDAINIADDGSDPFGPDLAPGNGKDTIDGGRGNDVIYGEDDDDLIFGGIGADTLYGGKDNDTIDGGSGQDDIIGGQGADSMFGGADRDEFFIENRTDAFGDTVDGGTDGNDVDKLDLRGLGKFEIVGETVDADGDSTSGTVNFLDSDGNVEGSLIFREIEKLIVCFTPGSLIGTARGEVPVENLREGDRVITRDNGVQEIRWVGHRQVTRRELMTKPEWQPVLVRKGSLGKGLPERDMLLSPNHRLLIANDQSALYFEDREVLAAAKHLINGNGITQVQASAVTYIHFMFDHHEVVLSDGTWTESFQPGDYSLNGIEDTQREEIFAMFPELKERDGLAAYGAARNTLKRHEAELLTF